MLNHKGTNKTWFKIGFPMILGAEAYTTKLDDVDVRIDELSLDFFPFNIKITQQSGTQVAFSIDFFLAKISFVVGTGRVF